MYCSVLKINTSYYHVLFIGGQKNYLKSFIIIGYQQVSRAYINDQLYMKQCKMMLLLRYYETMRRRNYVTPTSYLELIKTFKSLLDHKRMEILTLKNRYIVGLEKLEFSESQVHTARNSNSFNYD